MQDPPQTAEQNMEELWNQLDDDDDDPVVDGVPFNPASVRALIRAGILRPCRFTAEEKRRIEQELEEKSYRKQAARASV